MADNHYEIGTTTQRAVDLRNTLGKLRQGMAELTAVLPVMTNMRTGDGSQIAHYANVVTFFAIGGADVTEQQTDAKALYDEINSTLGNSAALSQLLARTG